MGDKTLRLHLIRHGKAAASAEDYDQLRPLGEAQARALGSHLGAIGQHFDAIHCGPHRRQIHTFELCRESAGAVGASWPEPIATPELAEAPYEELLKLGLMERLPFDPPLQALIRTVRDAGEDPAALRASMVAVFDHMARLWHQDEFGREGMQTAAEFHAQVDAALQTMLTSRAEGDVAAFTSNGVIATMLGSVTGEMPGEAAVLMIANASVSVLERTGDRIEVQRVSDTSHLDDELVTIL